MKISMNTSYPAKCFGDKEAIRIIARAGFDAFDYTVGDSDDDNPVYGENYREYVAELAKTAEECQIVCNQAHASFPPRRWGDEEYNQKTFKRIIREMEAAALLGAKSIVVHPITSFPEGTTREEIMEQNMEFYGSLLPYCRQFGIKVAVENMFTRDKKRGIAIGIATGMAKDFREYMEKLDQEWFVACLDLGHSSLVGEEGWDVIPVLGKKYLHALHVQDTDYLKDLHTLPYTGKLEWDGTLKALAEIDYEDEFTLEASYFLKGFPKDFLQEAVTFMGKVARYMANRIEEEKQNIRRG